MYILKNSDVQGKKKVTFICVEEPGKKISLAGTFNDWNPKSQEMIYSVVEKAYRCDLLLAPGTYEYKMVVDGRWVIDDGNDDISANDFGTLNSVLKVK